ncbi:MAG TPA: response regulator [Candidatus Binatia bacterium]|jgi:DNA-binding response OmpR family regulator|nr:response regulator [Candidatus Binatia bacterium]
MRKKHDSGKKKILVIEDDRLFSDIYAAKFAEEGFDVLLAADGEEGRAKLVAEKPDVVLLDIMLPKITGIDLLELIRKHEDERVKAMPVIVVTNLSRDQYEARIRAYGIEAYFLKSDVLFSQVLAKIQEIFSRKK